MLATCLAVTEYLMKATLRQEGFIFDSQLKDTELHGREVGREALEAGVSTVRKQREMNSAAQLTSSLYPVLAPSPWHGATHRKVGLPLWLL